MELRVAPIGDGSIDELRRMVVDARAWARGERGGAALLVDLGVGGDGVDVSTWIDGDRSWFVGIASIDDVPVGYVVGRWTDGVDERVATVREVWVDPEARRVGAGEALLSAAIAWAIAEDAVAIDAFALPGARESKNLFERLGLTARCLTVRRSLR